MRAHTARAHMNRRHGAVHEHLGLLHVGVKDAVLFRRPQRPPNTVFVSDAAAEHFRLSAIVALSHRISLSTRMLDKQHVMVAREG